MITLSRRTLRTLRGVLRPSALGVTRRDGPVPVVLHAEGRRLRARIMHRDLAFEYVEAGDYRPIDSVAVPLSALPELSKRRGPVAIESTGPDAIVVRWLQGGAERRREYATTPLGKIEPFPDLPDEWSPVPVDVLDALEQAAETCTGGSSRYALDCIQLRGRGGKVIATDGRQLLIRSGYSLPWDGDVLIGASPIYGCAGLPRDRRPEVGRTGTHVALRLGPWTILAKVRLGARFPDVEQVIPGAGAGGVRLRLDPEDARFVNSALDSLGGDSPVTVDLNGEVAVRARDPAQERVTELVLNRSGYTGEEMRISTDRTHLARALRLGIGEVEIGGIESPLVCRDAHRIYAWQPLSADAAIGPDDDAVRLESPRTERPDATGTSPSGSPATPMNEPSRRNGRATPAPSSNGHGDGEPAGSCLASLLRDAETLHRTLTEARTATARLISGLRKHRRQSRMLAETLRSLRQLPLADVVE